MRMILISLLATLLSAFPAASGQLEFSGKVRVIDGDTIDVGRVRVRLHGIDAPEQDQTCTAADGRDWPCGRWVTREVRTTLEGRNANCQPKDIDRYGRTVARCLVDGQDIGAYLVQSGLAFAYVKYSTDYVGNEIASRHAGMGLHASRFQDPAAFRRAKQQSAPRQASTGCLIKGNISSNGQRIYHSPGQRDYDQTRIQTGKGERWFCSAAEARDAGWRAAKR
jgi:endonuclease YncB( thermonuclease family)